MLLPVAATCFILLIALVLDALVGDPPWAYGRLGHPVRWLGALIAGLERRLNDPARDFVTRRRRGVAALVAIAAVPAAAAALLQGLVWAAAPPLAALLLLALPAATLIAQRSLWDHVAAVAAALERRDLVAARGAVSLIVGRDPESLDDAGIARAAIESLAENFSDGVVAPAFWMAALGLPGLAAYKAINTADSMIGHRSPRYAAFGWAAARLDDGVNLPAARLAALWLVLAALATAGADGRAALATVRRDAGRHRSPNAGWPEAAMAGALGLRLAGPRVYGGQPVEDQWMGAGRARAEAGDIRRALQLYRRACAVQVLVVALAAALAWALLA